MRRILLGQLPSIGAVAPISDEECHHWQHVLRGKPGDQAIGMDGRGSESVIELYVDPVHGNRLCARGVTEPKQAVPNETAPITLELALIKSDSFEWALEKSVELGARAFRPIMTARCVVDLSKRDPEAKIQRWQKIADQALKQCGRLSRLEILPPLTMPDLFAISLAANTRRWVGVPGASTPLAELANFKGASHLLVGPEGGWEPAELQLIREASAVNLGPLTLRAETAAIVMMTASRFF